MTTRAAPSESFFPEMKRYVGFGLDEEEALRRLAPHAAPHFATIADRFYERLGQHDDARRVFADDNQVLRLKGTLQAWLELLVQGPWDDAYYQRRARIGKKHVEIALPQRYMFGGIDLIRLALDEIAERAFADDREGRRAVQVALHKIIDLELAIMLETYAESFVARVQHLERVEKELLRHRLAASEARYQEIVEKGEALIVTWEPDGTIALFNRRCEELTGVPRALAAASTWFEVFGVERGAAAPGPAPIETTVVDPAGMRHAVRWRLTTLVEADRSIVCAIGLDVTEEHALGVRTRRAERLASLGTMAAGLAHEIRNPLNAAHLQLTLVDRRLGRPTADVAGAREAAGLAAGEIQRLAALVGEFLDFARPQPLRRDPGDLRALAEALVALVAPEAARAGVALAIAPGEPVELICDGEKLTQVLHNLVRNAIEATGPGGSITIRLRAAGARAVLEVEDDGPGFAADAPVFEPFFTTKEAGTGLGLSIVHRIVSDHGGTIDVHSRPGATVFSVNLPRSM